MPCRLDFKLILSLTVLLVAISCVGGFLNYPRQQDRLIEKQLSRSITSATWHAILGDVRQAAYSP